MLLPRTALAKDAVEASIENYGSNGVLTENGSFQTPGTYAIGTIKLNYVITANQFPTTPELKNFDLCLEVLEGKPKPPTNYPATVHIDQIGSSEILLDLEYDNVVFNEQKAPNHPCVNVKVSVPEAVANDPAYQVDGTELVGILQLSTDSGTHLDTVTTVKVYLTLVHPLPGICVVPLHFVANNDITTNLSSAGISLAVHMTNGLNTSQQGKHVIALVNTCAEAKTVDLKTAISPYFGLQSASAVQTTTVNQEFIDIAALLSATLNSTATWAGNGTNLCLNGVNLPGNQTFVVAEHIQMNPKILTQGQTLPAGSLLAKHPGQFGPNQGLTGWSYGGFTYEARADSDGATCGTGALSGDVSPNQGNALIPINVITYNGPGAPNPNTEYP